MKEEFGKWIVGAGLRELIESFGLFLDEVFLACLNVAVSKNVLQRDKAQELLERFVGQAGIKEKLSELNQTFGVRPHHAEYFVTINQVRRCLTHRRGVVSKVDFNEGKTLALRWRWIDLSVRNKSGKITKIQIPIQEPMLVQEGGAIVARWTERKRRYKENSPVNISPKDLAEICAYVSMEARNVMVSLRKYFEQQGIPIEARK